MLRLVTLKKCERYILFLIFKAKNKNEYRNIFGCSIHQYWTPKNVIWTSDLVLRFCISYGTPYIFRIICVNRVYFEVMVDLYSNVENVKEQFFLFCLCLLFIEYIVWMTEKYVNNSCGCEMLFKLDLCKLVIYKIVPSILTV